MELLWPGDDPAKLGNRLSVALTTLRTVLGRDLEAIRADADAVSLDLGLVAVDVERFLAEVELGLEHGDVARLVARRAPLRRRLPRGGRLRGLGAATCANRRARRTRPRCAPAPAWRPTTTRPCARTCGCSSTTAGTRMRTAG